MKTFLLANIALAFYLVGAIWAIEVDIFRSWRLVNPTDFPAVQRVHWRKLPFWIFTPLALALLGSTVLIWYHPPDSPPWAIWGNLACQLLSLLLTGLFWGRWQARLSNDPRGITKPLSRENTAHSLDTHGADQCLCLHFAGMGDDRTALNPINIELDFRPVNSDSQSLSTPALFSLMLIDSKVVFGETMANKIDRLTVRSCLVGLWSHLSAKPVHRPPEDHAQDSWLLFFASSISISLFLAAACLIGCNGLATSHRPSTTSSANSIGITSTNHAAAGYGGSVIDAVQSAQGKLPSAAIASSFAAPTPTSVPSMSLRHAPLQITNGILPDGAVQGDYDTALEATGGVPPYHWDATAGKIAPGLTLRSSTGTISGIPFTPGTFSFTARVQDSRGASLSTTVSLNISAAPPATVSDVVPDEGSVDGGSVVMISDQSLNPR